MFKFDEPELYRFFISRLPKPPEPFRSKPCLAEDWFVEDMAPLVKNYVTTDELRKIWRVAQMQRLGLFSGPGDPRLLLEQMTMLIPEMLAKADEIFMEQANAHD